MDLRQRDLEIVRQTAELLASGGALSEIFERLCVMLAQFIDASVVFIAIVDDDGPYIEFLYDHGASSRDLHRRVRDNSQTMRVAQTLKTAHFNSRRELEEQGPRIPLPLPDARDDDSNSAIFVPLRVGQQAVGVLSVQSTLPDAYSAADVHLLETCALYLAVAVDAERVRQAANELISEQGVDAVTGVATRRLFDERLRRDWLQARRNGSPLSLLLLDVDWFKRFNDAYGHVAGDACLRQVAQAARGVLSRDTDLFARYGGEEFAAILWGTDTDGAYATAERMRHAVLQLGISHAESPVGCVTLSVGVSTSVPSTALPDSLVRAADRALYAAKTAGRNRVVLDQFNASALRAGERRNTTHNLPPFTTSFLGRSEEVNAVAHALLSARLVSIVGPGGVGKTRVAVAAAERRLYAYTDGVWFVDLRSVDHPDYLISAVAHALNVTEQPGYPLSETLVRELSHRKLLLMLDNCEHLREAVAELCESIGAGAPDVTMLATTREPLRLPIERVLMLRPLDETTALALFRERSQGSDANLSSEAEREYAAAICARLDRLPLAIELAAPQLKSMSLERLHASLDDRFGLLGSLLDVVAWSYDLLDERARRLLENMSTFPSSARPDAVRDICADGELEPWDISEPLEALLEKNLVSIVGEAGNERYALLESTREFARGKLRQRGDEANVACRHVRYCRALARRIRAHVNKGETEEALALAGAEWENLRTALDRGLRQALDRAAGRSIAHALAQFWTESGRISDGAFWTAFALDDAALDGDERAEMLYAAALVAHAAGDFERLATLAEELVAIHEKGKDPRALARALNALGNARFKTGDAQTAETLYVRALAAYRMGRDRRGAAVALMNLGSLVADWKLEYGRAHKLFEEALAIFRSLGISVNAGIVLANLGEINGYQERFEDAVAYANESLSIFERLGNRTLAAWQLVDLARYWSGLKNYPEAARLLRQARRYLSDQPAFEHLANYFETAMIFTCDVEAFELSARIAGFLERYRDEHHQPRTASLLTSYGDRIERIERHAGRERFRELFAAGSNETASALQDEIDTLGIQRSALASVDGSEHTTP